MHPDYVFFLQDENNRFYQLDSTGKIILSTKPYELHFSPDGWNEIEIKNARNKKWWGIDRSVTLPLQYVKDGAQIIKHVMMTKGVDAPLFLFIGIDTLDYDPGVDHGFWYKKLFRGQVDLSTYLHDGVKVTARTLSQGLAKFLESNENTTYEFPMNVPEAIMVKMDGMNLHEKANFRFTDSVDYKNVRYVPSFELLGTEGDNYRITQISEFYESVSGSAGADETYVQSSENYFFKNEGEAPVIITLTGRVGVRSNRNDTLPLSSTRITVKSSRDNGFGGTYEYDILNVTPTALNDYYYDLTASPLVITVYPGEKLFMFGITASVNDALYNFFFLPDSNIYVSFITRRAATYVPHFRAQYLWSQLLSKVTDGEFTAEYSTFLAAWGQVVFTCGDAIRGLVDDNGNSLAVFKWSIEGFRQFWDSFFSVGISEDGNRVQFDEKINITDRINRITLPEPTAPVKIKYVKGYGFNVLKNGYPEISSEIGALNGNEEFNCGFEWTTGTSHDPAPLDKVSKIKASCYEQEKIRTTLFSKTTTDNKSDNTLFVNYIEWFPQPAGTGFPIHYKLDRSLNATIPAGIMLEPLTIWNLRLSPKRMFLNNGAWFRSCLFLGDSKIFKYTSSDKNNKLICDGIVEKDDVPVSTLGAKFFYPLVMVAELPMPEDYLELLDINPNAEVEMMVDGDLVTGIRLDDGVAPTSNKAMTIEILLDSNNNIQKWIDYNG